MHSFGKFISIVLLQLLLHSIFFVSCNPYLVSEDCPYKYGLFGDNPQIRMHESCEQYITSAEKCRQELVHLQIRFDNSADFQEANMEARGVASPSSDRPPGCYGYGGSFYFNTDQLSSRKCGFMGRMCVCQRPACQPCPKESYSFGGFNVRCTPCPRETDEVYNYPKIVEQCKQFWDEPVTDL